MENFDPDLKDISNLFDWDYDEGLMRLMDNFGMEDTACPSCIDEVRQKIGDIRRSQYDEDRAMDDYYANRRS